MSDYTTNAIDPRTGKIEQVRMRDNYFGHYRYGVQFPDGVVLERWQVKLVETEIIGDSSDYDH